jgi:LysM domain
VLAVEPRHPQALNYVRQIETDPVALLGRESYPYSVRPGESLSSIARDRLRDTNLFYALARYNNIKVPRQLAAGQIIRVPGKAPAPAPSAAAPAAAPAPAPVAPPAPATPPPAPAPAAPAPPTAAQQQARIATLMREGRGFMARQDLCNAVRSFDKVLEIDGNHGPARSDRQKALDLAERLRRQGSKLDC